MAEEVLDILTENVPTAAELPRRQEFFKEVGQLQSAKPNLFQNFLSAEEMLLLDRGR